MQLAARGALLLIGLLTYFGCSGRFGKPVSVINSVEERGFVCIVACSREFPFRTRQVAGPGHAAAR